MAEIHHQVLCLSTSELVKFGLTESDRIQSFLDGEQRAAARPPGRREETPHRTRQEPRKGEEYRRGKWGPGGLKEFPPARPDPRLRPRIHGPYHCSACRRGSPTISRLTRSIANADRRGAAEGQVAQPRPRLFVRRA